MDIRYLESLITIVELGSIARAAHAQNLTPAAVGQRIHAIEKNFKIYYNLAGLIGLVQITKKQFNILR